MTGLDTALRDGTAPDGAGVAAHGGVAAGRIVAVGLLDRSHIALGFETNVNLIDHASLMLHASEMVQDVPVGGLRLDKPTAGHIAAAVDGQLIQHNHRPASALSNRLMRGNQPQPGMIG
ncbi:hypothetical protein O4H52_01700 [Sphingomonadaceae bacterium G21617-S1]|nr:hypothetical protein [Sphingomonadaceae bacterium G21617-S1]